MFMSLWKLHIYVIIFEAFTETIESTVYHKLLTSSKIAALVFSVTSKNSINWGLRLETIDFILWCQLKTSEGWNIYLNWHEWLTVNTSFKS